MRVLIVGGTGLIGRYATLELLRRGHSVSVMARRPPSPGSLPAEVEYVPGDLLEELEPRTFEGIERIRVNGSLVERVLRRKDKVVDSDLPYVQRGRRFLGPIAEAYCEFRAKNKEPGA